MQEKLYNLKMKILKNKSINDNLKMELAEEIFQIEKEIAINYTRCCKSDSELLVCYTCKCTKGNAPKGDNFCNMCDHYF